MRPITMRWFLSKKKQEYEDQNQGIFDGVFTAIKNPASMPNLYREKQDCV